MFYITAACVQPGGNDKSAQVHVKQNHIDLDLLIYLSTRKGQFPKCQTIPVSLIPDKKNRVGNYDQINRFL